MKNKRKKLALLMSASLTINLISIISIKVSGSSSENPEVKQSVMLEQSIDFLKSSCNDDGSFGSYINIINDTAEAAAVIRNYDNSDISKTVSWLKNNGYDENIDTLSRTAAASGDSAILDSVITYANADGGFGLHKDYASDVLDSVLVLEAINACGSDQYIENGSALCIYLADNVNSDGGWSYSSGSDSDVILTAMVSYSIDKFLDDNMLTSDITNDALSSSNSFLRSNAAVGFDRESIEETLYSNISFMQYEGSVDYKSLLNGLNSVQYDNGSFYDDIHITALAARLLEDICLSDTVNISGMSTSLNSYSGYFGKDQNIVSLYNITYLASAEEEYILKTTVTNGETVIYTEEVPVVLSPDNTVAQGTAADFTLNEMRDDGITVTSQLCSGDKIIKTDSHSIAMEKVPVAGATEITDFTLELNQYNTYVGMPFEVTADFKLLYATNVDNSIDMKFTVSKDGTVIKENNVSAELILSGNSVQKQGITFTPDADSEETYIITAQCIYDDKVVVERSCEFKVTEQVKLEEKGDDPDAKSEIVISWAGPVLSDYCVYSGSETTIDANAEILYYSNGDFDGIVSMQVISGDEIIAERDETITIEKGDITHFNGIPVFPKYDTEEFLSFAVKEKGSVDVKVQFKDTEGNILGEGKRSVNIIEKPVQDLILYSDNKDGVIDLSWNDITNDFDEYNYRLYRRTEKNDWEPRSIWNESEKVRVLNIYPAQPYLANWMTTTISDTETPAGMGLFDIDSVHIGMFNNDPETYLIDESGAWKYDVLFFGSSDSNSFKDLSDASYSCVQDFVDSGRGVLFGHDTVCLNTGHTNFTKFADQLGILVKVDSNFYQTNSTSVVSIGTLTNFPWMIRGTLNIPSCHSLGQYVGGSLTGKEWLTLNAQQIIDEETGAHSNFYLVTNNNLGMIQTGHSNGAATDDERKVLANTLFYLHQISSLTTAKDSSFYDIDAPDMPSVTAGELSEKSIPLSLSSKDNGTVYEYYIAAEPIAENNSGTVNSNVVTETAFADMKGFVVEVNNSGGSSPELVEYDENHEHIVNIRSCDADGNLDTSAEIPDYNEQYYIHVFAVDNADNISEEVIIPVGIAKINAKVVTDKDIYIPGETVNVSSESTAVLFGVTADVELNIYDENGNLTLVIAEESTQSISPDEPFILGGSWIIPEILAGGYKAEIVWKDGENILASANYEFRIASNGSLSNSVHTDKKCYRVSEPVEILNNVRNSSTNSAEKNLALDITVYNAESHEIASFNSEIATLHPNSDYFYNDIIKPGKLGAGNYTVYAVVKDENGKIIEDSAEFEVIETSAVITGKLDFSPGGDYSQKADFSVTNNSDSDISDAVVRVKIYPENSSECIGTIVKHTDIKAGETINFSETADTSAYGISTYIGVLTVETANDMAELDTDTFIVEKEYIAPAETTVSAGTEKADTTTTTTAKPVKKSDPPKTGDDVPLVLWITTLISAAGLMVICITGGKKNAEKKN